MKKNTFEIEPILDIAAACALKEALLSALKNKSVIVIKANKVERVTSAGAQLLVAVVKYADEQHASLTLQSPSDVLTSALTRLGLEALINEKVAA